VFWRMKKKKKMKEEEEEALCFGRKVAILVREL